MNRLFVYAVAFCLAIFGSCAKSATACNLPENSAALATAVQRGVNAQRQATGLTPLTQSAALSRAAAAHACDMHARGFFGHTGSNGSNVQVRVRATGYRDCLVAENLGWG